MRAATLVLFALLAACSGVGSGERPEPSLASSLDSARVFEEIRDELARDRSSAALKLKLERFLERFPDDGLAPLAHLLLANALIDRNDVESGRKQTFAAGLPPPGNTSDWRIATLARLQRRAGKSEATVQILQTLVGKVVDAPLRDMIVEELALAAVEAHRDLDAIAALDTWLRAASEEQRDAVREKVQAALERMAPDALERAMHTMQGDIGGYSPDLRRILALVVGKRAVDVGNTKLAQWLLQSDSARWLVGTPLGQDLRDLATSLRGSRTVSGRTIGLLLPTASPELREAAADVARGAAFALDLPRRQADDDGSTLVTRSAADVASIDAALEEIAGAGAAVILAGFDAESSEHVRAWSETNGIPVIILGVPQGKPSRFSFVVGESPATSVGLLLSALEGGKPSKVAAIASPMSVPYVTQATTSLSLLAPVRCEPPLSRSLFPTADWQRDSVRAFLVAGSEACARALSFSLPSGRLTVGLSLEALTGFEGSTASVHVLGVAAGLLPVDAASAAKDPKLGTFKTQFGTKPTWWTALGHDAALLARKAVQPLPLDATDNGTEVTRRRETARSGLLEGKGALWTTEASGFAGDHALQRTLRVVDLPAK